METQNNLIIDEKDLSDKSKNSKSILRYFEKKYCKSLSVIGLLKCCSVMSALFKDKPRLSLCMIAPTRQFKSRTNEEIKNIFSPKYFIDLGSDFTIHSLYQQYGKAKTGKMSINKRCLMINDGTLLLSSKAKKTKDRLINGLAELLSEGQYLYSDNLSAWTLKGEVSIIINMTLESYCRNKNDLLNNTFLERFLTVYYELGEKDIENFLINKRARCMIHYDDKKLAKLKDYELNEDLGKYGEKITKYSKKFSFLSYRSILGTHDIVEALLKSHACLNERHFLHDDDFKFLDMIVPYLIDLTATNQHIIVRMANNGLSQKEICENLGKDSTTYQSYVSKVIKTAKLRGILLHK